MRVGIFNSHMKPMGGTERVTLATIDAISRLGWEVDLYLVEAFRPADLAAGFGMATNVHCRFRRTKIPGFFVRLERPPRGGIYLNIFRRLIEKRVEECDIFIDMVPFLSVGAVYFRLPDLAYWNLPPPNLKSYSIAGEVYLWPIHRLLPRFSARWQLVKVHVANSEYTRDSIVERLDRSLKPIVIYPPVDIHLWSVDPHTLGYRSGIASFARFEKWKRHDIQLKLVRRMGSRLRMIGRAVREEEVAHLERLKEIARDDDHVEFCVNLPQNEVKRLLCSSKVFIHTADGEPFGITTVEAIAAGCVPIVREDGAASEVVPFEELRFKAIGEGREKIRRALAGEYDHLLPKLTDHIKQFDQQRFKQEMMKTLGELAD